MVDAIRNIEKAISGSGKKEPSISETKNIVIARKSIHFNRDLPVGHIITEQDIVALRPGDGISPMEWNTIIGKKINKDKLRFDKLQLSDLK
jgi:N-acetylneuraminate synthase/N,N'-diacetyllegionaminate synthase